MAASTLKDIAKDGAFVRKASVFRNAISKAAGAQYPPAAGRYLLYVSLACPWAHRCLITRKLKGLERAIDVAVVAPVWGRTKPDVDDHEGWVFDTSFDAASTVDPVYGAKTVREVYERSTGDANVVTRFTVPILFDKETRTIVNNESSEIIRFLNSEFNDFAEHAAVDLYPAALTADIDAVADGNYETVNNGVYKCGFAQSQAAYDAAVGTLFDRLDHLERVLGSSRYLCSNTAVTFADIRLFVTLIRFDEVYVVHFKTNKKLIREYPNLHGWMADLYRFPGVAETVNMHHIKAHYYVSHKGINTYGIVPIGGDALGRLLSLPSPRSLVPVA